MATISELKAKRAKAETNKFLPDEMRKKVIAKIDKEISELERKSEKKPAEKKPAREKLINDVKTKSTAKKELHEYQDEVIEQLIMLNKTSEWYASKMVNKPENHKILFRHYNSDSNAKHPAINILSREFSNKKGALVVVDVEYKDADNYKDSYSFGVIPEKLSSIFGPWDDGMDVSVDTFGFTKPGWSEFLDSDEKGHDYTMVEIQTIYDFEAGKALDNEDQLKSDKAWSLALSGNKSTAEKHQKKETKSEKKEEKDKSGSKKKDDEYDCDDLIKKERERASKAKKSAKKSAAKPEVKKTEEAIKKTGDAIEAKYKDGKLTKPQIMKIIKQLLAEVDFLQKLLKKAK